MKNLWISSKDEKLLPTENIYKIIEEQCIYISDFTENKISAVFEEVHKYDDMSNLLTEDDEFKFNINTFKIEFDGNSLGELSHSLCDASVLYNDLEFELVLYTDWYRFRLFTLTIKPIYPVVIKVDEGINQEINSQIANHCRRLDKPNSYSIANEKAFCYVLNSIFCCNKVQFIIHELMEMAEKSEASFTLEKSNEVSKVIFCEGLTDELVLEAVANRLNAQIHIERANGKANIVRVASRYINKYEGINTDYMALVDSDGDEIGTRAIIEKNLPFNCQLVIVNNTIEDWFFPDRNDFSTARKIVKIREIVETADFEQIAAKNSSFGKVVDFISSKKENAVGDLPLSAIEYYSNYYRRIDNKVGQIPNKGNVNILLCRQKVREARLNSKQDINNLNRMFFYYQLLALMLSIDKEYYNQYLSEIYELFSNIKYLEYIKNHDKDFGKVMLELSSNNYALEHVQEYRLK